MFPDADVSSSKFQKFAAKLQTDPKANARKAFRAVTAIQPGKKEDPSEAFFSKIAHGSEWFAKALGMFTTMAGALGELPGSLAGLMALMYGPKMLGKAGGMLAKPGRAIGGAFKGAGGAAMKIPGMKMAGKAAGIAGKGLGAAAKFLGPIAAVTMAAYAYQDAFFKAGKILGKNEEDVTNLERTTVGAAAAINGILLGIPELIFGPDTVKNIASGLTKPADWLSDLIFGGDDDVAKGKPSDEEMYQAARKRGGSALEMSQAEWNAQNAAKRDEGVKVPPTETDAATAVQASGAAAEEATALPTQGSDSPPKTAAPPAAGSGASARATASTSGGRLILEVENFDAIMAQVQNDQTAISG